MQYQYIVIYLHRNQKQNIMKFTKTNSVSKVNGLDIVRYKKNGTKRIFFRPELNGNPVTSTMFARQYDAEALAKRVKFN